MSAQTPYEQVRFIRDVIKDRTDKSQPTFFSVKLESFGNVTPLVDKEQGSLFYDTIIQYLMRYDLSALIVDLFHGKSHNIKDPFQSFRIQIKRSPNVSLSGIDKKENVELTQSETIISPEKHFHTLATKEFDLLRLQYENDVLRKKNKKKKAYIKELEAELAKSEKEKTGGIGNVALGSVASNAIEKFARSQFGIGLLKNVFGAKDEVLQGLLGAGTEETQTEETKSTATLIKKSEEEKQLTGDEKIRYQLKKHIIQFLEKSDDATLRLYYEIILLIGGDVQLLQSIFMQIKKYREAEQKVSVKQPDSNTAENKKENEEEENEDVNDTS